MISILIPYKNVELYFRECLQSIVNQSYTDYECILLNDHSTDNSELIALEFCNSYSKFKNFQATSHGLIQANIELLSLAKGEFITRMDADDMMHTDKLQFLYEELLQQEKIRTNPVIVCCNVQFFPESEIKIGTEYYQNWLNLRNQYQDHKSHIWRECTVPSPAWLMRRETMNRIHGFKNYTYPEDYEMAFQLILNNIFIAGISHKLHFWRLHKNRFSKNYTGYNAVSFMHMRWKYFKTIILTNNFSSEIYILGNGKKSKLLQKIIEDDGYSFVIIDPFNTGVKNYYIKFDYRQLPFVISTLSSLDNYKKIYNLIQSETQLYYFA